MEVTGIWLQHGLKVSDALSKSRLHLCTMRGPVAKRTRHLTTNQEIAGSSPARVKHFHFRKKNIEFFSKLLNFIVLHIRRLQ